MSEKIIAIETEAKNTQEGPQDGGERENVVVLGKPYTFEGKEYTEIDLSGLDGLTIRDAVDVQKALFGQQETASALVCETTTSFAMAIAARATGLPIEFFKLMPRGAGMQVKRAVQSYISSKHSEGAVLRLEKPYVFRDTVYEEIDLSAIGEMSTIAESAAENEMAREGIIITENSFNYLYACIIAAMAIMQPKEFFTGLPLCELLKLKETVNSADFFA